MREASFHRSPQLFMSSECSLSTCVENGHATRASIHFQLQPDANVNAIHSSQGTQSTMKDAIFSVLSDVTQNYKFCWNPFQIYINLFQLEVLRVLHKLSDKTEYC